MIHRLVAEAGRQAKKLDAAVMIVNRQTNREVGMENDQPSVRLYSFGYKYGAPLDTQMIFDLRALPNPFWVAGLRRGSGLDPAVAAYVLDNPAGAKMLEFLVPLIHFSAALWAEAGKGHFTVALGCTGGHHRSVAMVMAIVQRLRGLGLDVTTWHRDLAREARQND
jgi:UPF0042 nucleotide-binding protein